MCANMSNSLWIADKLGGNNVGRIKLVLGAAVLMVGMLSAIAGPAMADDFTRCKDLNGDFVRCDGDLFQQVDNNGFNDFGFNNFNDCNDGLFNDCNDGLFNDCNDGLFNDCNDGLFLNDGLLFDSCPFAGDTRGIVNELDCLN